MWLTSQFIIRPIHELMGRLHMVRMTPNPFLVCFVMLHACNKHHIWAQLSLGYTTTKYMTSIKQFGENMWMQVKAWHKMI
jgi:hypothetical protein